MRVLLWADTTDATPTELFRDGVSRRVTIATGVSLGFLVRIVGRRTGGDPSAHFTIEGSISNQGGTVVLDGIQIPRIVHNELGAGLPVVQADDTNKAIVIFATGAAGVPIHWEADLQMQRSTA
jgi:hypothetical protein